MSTDQETTRIVRSWLEDGATQLPDSVLGGVLAELPTTRQRRATPWAARRTPIMNKIVGYGLAAAAVVAAVYIGIQLFGSPGGMGADPNPTATPEPTATPDTGTDLPEGSHLLVDASAASPPTTITVTIAAPDWHGTAGQGFIQWGPTGADGPSGAGMIGFIEDEYYVFGDPCAWSSTTPDTPATTVDELVAALGDQASREASAPEDVTVDGYSGKKIILSMADEVTDFAACDPDAGSPSFGLFAVGPDGAPWRYSQAAGQVEEIWALDVDGQLVVNIGAYYSETPQHVIDEVRAILASATFELP